MNGPEAAVAVVGMACRYPDADTPQALWGNALASHRSFRRIPASRLDADDYWSADPAAPDRTYATHAAVLEDFAFDRVAFRVAGSTFRSADLTHWLALDVAAQALADAGHPEAQGLDRDRVGVVLGNTLTGEFSRAGLMRLRWPYVRRVVDAALEVEGWYAEARAGFLERLEASYKAPFAPVVEETLAGGLSNTIAGRICNQFDLHGGGYTVDAACAASLLAVVTACNSLAASDLDVALAGGVDLSLDPFELVGFAKTGALARHDMRVFDRRSEGFWPGEGCGIVTLMRLGDARARGYRIYGVIRGWGVASDGAGGLTRPEAAGQRLAVDRAFVRAGTDPASVALFEAHGTGTPVGDRTELAVLRALLEQAGVPAQSTAVGSVKANIGHTKAAAGAAGLIKALMAVTEEVIPPHAGCADPVDALTDHHSPLRLVTEPEPWPVDRAVRAGVSAMGFGGINTHLVVERADARVRRGVAPHHRRLGRRHQGAEVLLLGASSRDGLRSAAAELGPVAGRMTHGELPGLALSLARRLRHERVRAAIVATTPTQFEQRLRLVDAALPSLPDGGIRRVDEGVWIGSATAPPRVGLLFSGQASPTYRSGGRWARQYPAVARRYAESPLPMADDDADTRIAQPAIVRASLVGVWMLERLGIEARGALGHSLGELTALAWAGALSADEVVHLVDVRASLMGGLPRAGAMVSVAADGDRAEVLAEGLAVAVAACNAADQTTVAGRREDIDRFVARARQAGVHATVLPVSHAFHSQLMRPVRDPLRQAAGGLGPRHTHRPVWSTVTGRTIEGTVDLAEHLATQVTAPVVFLPALRALAAQCDVLCEVGPGQVLADLARRTVDLPVTALDAGGPTVVGLLSSCALLHAAGAPLVPDALFEDRAVTALELSREPRFLANPCAQVPDVRSPAARGPTAPPADDAQQPPPADDAQQPGPADDAEQPGPGGHAGRLDEDDLLEAVREAVSAHAELPVGTVGDDDRLLSDLHLNSITVAQIASEIAAARGFPPPLAPGELADATVARLAELLAELAGGRNRAAVPGPPAGAASWVRAFITCHEPAARLATPPVTAWTVYAQPGDALGDALRAACPPAPDPSVVVVRVPDEPALAAWRLLHDAAMSVGHRDGGHFVLVQSGWSSASFARTLHLERPSISTTVVEVPPERASVAAVAQEAGYAAGHREVRYARDGTRTVPVLTPWPLRDASLSTLTAEDLVLVTGGGKGIGAEAARFLAATTGARLALLGRAVPSDDPELAATLGRLEDENVAARYLRADVTDAHAVHAALSRLTAEHGPVTALLHAAGVNRPASLENLDEAAWNATVGPKVVGLRNVLAALDPAALRLAVGFGSIIATLGLHGQADYALANEWMAQELRRFQRCHGGCRCLAVAWSVWAQVGMGTRLGALEGLAAQGVSPIPPDDGLRALRALLAEEPTPSEVVVAGRFGSPPTVRLPHDPLPLWRWIERVLVHYPRVELVVEAEVSAVSDPYVSDHVLDGVALIPGVIGLEAMAQVAAAAHGAETVAGFEQVEFLRPITVPAEGTRRVRIAALCEADGTARVAVRSDESAFGVEHFRGVVRVQPRPTPPLVSVAQGPAVASPALYRTTLFHGHAFQRVRGYRELTARRCVVDIDGGGDVDWFGAFHPSGHVLGDPGARDAAIHCLQGCIPQRRLIPVSVEALELFQPVTGRLVVTAEEVEQRDDVHVYDVTVSTLDGAVCERWTHLRLHEVAALPVPPWPDPLLGPYLEREWSARLPAAVRVATQRHRDDSPRQDVTDLAIRRVTDSHVPVGRLPGGRPTANGAAVSAAHAAEAVLATASSRRHGCDVEVVTARTKIVWKGMLGSQRWAVARLLASLQPLTLDRAATALWVARECLLKLGRPEDEPLAVRSSDGSWCELAGGDCRVWVWLGDTDAPVIGIAMNGEGLDA